jgi:hypothetical protein
MPAKSKRNKKTGNKQCQQQPSQTIQPVVSEEKIVGKCHEEKKSNVQILNENEPTSEQEASSNFQKRKSL